MWWVILLIWKGGWIRWTAIAGHHLTPPGRFVIQTKPNSASCGLAIIEIEVSYQLTFKVTYAATYACNASEFCAELFVALMRGRVMRIYCWASSFQWLLQLTGSSYLWFSFNWFSWHGVWFRAVVGGFNSGNSWNSLWRLFSTVRYVDRCRIQLRFSFRFVCLFVCLFVFVVS